jgi:hypothetical protein
MSETTTLVIAEIPEPKTGTGKKGKWTRYAFKDGNDEFFSTFQKSAFEPAYELKGQKAKVTYEVDGDFKNIVSIEPAEQSQNGVGGEDEPDWDLIGLRKTRCVLWEAVLPVAMQAGISAWTKAAQGEYDSAQLAGFVVRFGRTLRMIAEADIFLSKPVEDPDDWVPFLVKPKTRPQGEDVEI